MCEMMRASGGRIYAFLFLSVGVGLGSRMARPSVGGGMKSHPSVPREQQSGATEKGKHLSAPSPRWCLRAAKIVKSISGRCD